MDYLQYVEKRTIEQAKSLGINVDKWWRLFESMKIICRPSYNTLIFNCPICVREYGKYETISLSLNTYTYKYPTWRCRHHNLTKTYYNSHIGLLRMIKAETYGNKISIKDALDMFEKHYKLLFKKEKPTNLIAQRGRVAE